MITLIILWVVYAIAEAYEDSQYTVILDHKPTLWPRLITGVLIIVVWFRWFGIPDALTLISFTLILMSVFWLVFELAGNLMRGNYAIYIGNTSWLDRKLRNYELPVFWLRIWLVMLSFVLYYYDSLLTLIHYAVPRH